MEIDLQKEFNSLNEKSSLEELQEYARKMIIARGFEEETPQDILMLLTEELGELAREVRKTTSVKLDKNADRTPNLGNEIADVFNYLLALCIANNIDLFEVFKKKEEINLKREWKQIYGLYGEF